MLVNGILQGENEWVGEFTYLYGQQQDLVAFKLAEYEERSHYVFTWTLADLIKLASGKTKHDVEVRCKVEGVILRWDGLSEEFQVVLPEDELDFSFTYLLSSIKEWIRAAKSTMIDRDILMGQAFGQMEIPRNLGIHCYHPEDYKEERVSKRWVR